MYATYTDTAAVVRHLIFLKAQQMTLQITQAAEEIGVRAAEQRLRVQEPTAALQTPLPKCA